MPATAVIQLADSGLLMLSSPYSSAAVSVLYRLFLSRMASVHLVHFIIKSLWLAFIWDRSLPVFVLCGADMFKEYRMLPCDLSVHSVQGSMYVTCALHTGFYVCDRVLLRSRSREPVCLLLIIPVPSSGCPISFLYLYFFIDR